MTDTATRDGKIITFYSFKGGVGRTMALANVAFLSALNGARVLTMDWDLEAPGLGYYFRCLHEAADARELKEAPGVLDFLCTWTQGLDTASSNDEVAALLTEFKSGAPFDRCVRSLLPPAHLENGGTLDIIGAGARHIGACNSSYEDALANFSWPTFFDEQMGGVMLQELRLWAKRNYDFVFLDSRTGLADIAGICTMQLPDTVGLCFVLNRQNIDGVARVANAIRVKRAEQIALHAVPMRVGAQDSLESSDAQAKAISELTRTGGFSLDKARDDVRQLSIFSADNIPYYETLAPFVATDASLDPLTLNYSRLASALLEKDVKPVPMDPLWIEQARRRLQPRLVTIDYVNKLRSADPSRGFWEMQRLTESALNAVNEGDELDRDYVEAIIRGIEAAESVDVLEAKDLYPSSLALLRTLWSEDSQKWHSLFALTLDRYIESYSFILDTEEKIEFLDELDLLLATNPTIEATIKRINRRRLAASTHLELQAYDAALHVAAAVRSMIETIRASQAPLSADQTETLNFAEVDVNLYSGIAYTHTKEIYLAYAEFMSGIEKINKASRPNIELRRAAVAILSELTRLEYSANSPEARVGFAISAMQWCPTPGLRAAQLVTLSGVVLQLGTIQNVLSFCDAAFIDIDNRGPSGFTAFVGRNMRLTREVLTTVLRILKAIQVSSDKRTHSVIFSLYSTVNSILASAAAIHRRGLGTTAPNTREIVEELKESFSQLGLELTEESSNKPHPDSPAAPYRGDE